MFVGYVSRGNDFYEPRTTGYSFHMPRRIQLNPTIETNSAKKYYVSFNYFVGLRSLFNSPNQTVNFSQRYRFTDKFSITQELNYNPVTNDAGYYSDYLENNVLKDIIFSRRDVKTTENIFIFKYNFNSKSGISFRARHYWSMVKPKQLYDLNSNGDLSPTIHTGVALTGQSTNFFNIDAVYTLQFAPGSFLNIVWKDQGYMSDNNISYTYLKDFNHTISAPQNNNLSVKVIYYLDYINFRKGSGKKK